jgi:hypothetical protein
MRLSCQRRGQLCCRGMMESRGAAAITEASEAQSQYSEFEPPSDAHTA